LSSLPIGAAPAANTTDNSSQQEENCDCLEWQRLEALLPSGRGAQSEVTFFRICSHNYVEKNVLAAFLFSNNTTQ
jgi:hypothetical protein